MSTQKSFTVENTAFSLELYKPLDISYYLKYAKEVIKLLEHFEHIRPKIYQAIDSFDLFYFDLNKLAEHIKKPPRTLWQKIMHKLLNSEKVQNINKITRHRADLAILAAYQLLKKIYSIAKYRPDLKFVNLHRQPTSRSVERYFEELAKEVAEFAPQEIERVITEYVEGVKAAEHALEAIPCLAGGRGYALDALSALVFLERPHEFRRRVKLLRDLALMFRKFSSMLPTTLTRAQVESSFGFVSGISQMRTLRDIVEMLPTELAMPKPLLMLRLMSQTALTRAKAGTAEVTVFIDKSGSMASNIPNTDITKISAACGLGLALYRYVKAKIYFFDTEIHELEPRELVKVLLTVRATGGTDIGKVLEKIRTLPRNRHYIVITDGISHVDIELAKKVAETHRVTFALIPPAADTAPWLNFFKVVKVSKPEDLIRTVTY